MEWKTVEAPRELEAEALRSHRLRLSIVLFALSFAFLLVYLMV